MDPASSPPPSVTIHEAFRTFDGSGVVEYGAVLTEQEAVDRRRQNLDIVVRGTDKRLNRSRARDLEELVGKPVVLDAAHQRTAGRKALPHYHQVSRSPDGHSFYEVDNRKAKKKKSP
jgi:hypothetical protein